MLAWFCALEFAACGHVTLNQRLDATAPSVSVRCLQVPPDPRCQTPRGALVGFAVSGGGSRAARYTAAIFEQLDHVSVKPADAEVRLMDEVDVISSVSGGSVASAYYVARRPTAPLRPDQAESDKFWPQFKSDMETDFECSMVTATIFNPANWSPSRSLSDVMAGRFAAKLYGELTLSDIATRAADPANGVPYLLINTTLYDGPHDKDANSDVWGRKFVFTGLPSHRFVSTAYRFGGGSVLDSAIEPVLLSNLASDWTSYPLARAVMSSATFPLVFRPLYVRDYAREPPVDVPLGDGGLYDNQGIETLLESTLEYVNDPAKARRLFIIAIDGSAPYAFSGSNFDEVPASVSIMERRASLFAQRYYEQSVLPNLPDAKTDPRVRILFVHFADPALAAIDQGKYLKLRAIGTRFHIAAEDVTLLDWSVHTQFSGGFKKQWYPGGPEQTLREAIEDSLKWAAERPMRPSRMNPAGGEDGHL